MVPYDANHAVAVDAEREPAERIAAIQKYGEPATKKKTRKPKMLIPGKKAKRRKNANGLE